MRWFRVSSAREYPQADGVLQEIELYLLFAHVRVTLHRLHHRRWCYAGKKYPSRHELLTQLREWQEQWQVRDAANWLGASTYSFFPGVCAECAQLAQPAPVMADWRECVNQTD